MAWVRRLVTWLHRAEDWVLVAALMSMLLTALMQIVMRNLFDSGLLWAESFLRILVLWIAMLGAMVATREGHHISVDVLSKVLAPGLRSIVRKISALFAACICLAAAYHAIKFIQYEYTDGTIAFVISFMTYPVAVPVWVCQIILPTGFAVMGIRFLFHLRHHHSPGVSNLPSEPPVASGG